MLSGSPANLVKVTWTVRTAVPGMVLGVNARGVGSRLTRDGDKLNGYTTLNLSVTYAPPGHNWSIGLGVYNLTNERHMDPVGPEHVQEAVQQDGRQVRLQLTRAL